MTLIEADLTHWVRWAATFADDPAEMENVLRAGVQATCPHCQAEAERQAEATHQLLKSAMSTLHEAVAHASSARIAERIARAS